MTLSFLGACASCVINIVYRCGTESLPAACARVLAQIPTGTSRVFRGTVVSTFGTRLPLRAMQLLVARRRVLCCMWDGVGAGWLGPLGARNGHHSGPHGTRKLVDGLPELHVRRVSRLYGFQGA